MGCRLAKPGINDRPGEEVWPPTIIEFVTGYERLDDLLRGDLVATGILGNVSFKAVYSPLEALIAESGFLPDGTEKFSAPFIYDWRRDIIETAERLAEHLDQVAREGADEITIIAHSTGGLVARLALEDPRSQGRRGISRTVLLVTVGTPHSGAPLALARALGLDGGVGISATGFKRISTDPRYPSGYQLLPTPDDAACWDQASGDLRPIDIYDPAKAARLGLVPDMVEYASNVHKRLREGMLPVKLRYVSTAGTGQG
jgi:pimeloyl-ACP methyl ester carboxylesterase